MTIGDKYICLRDIQITENHILNSKYMVLKVISIEKRNEKTYIKVTNDKDIYEVISSLLLDAKYFKQIA